MKIPEMRVSLLGYSRMNEVGPDEIVGSLLALRKEGGVSSVLVKELSNDDAVLDSVAFTFGFENVSRVLEVQQVRHRKASYSIQSGRYVDRTGKTGVVPKTLRENEEALEIIRVGEENNPYEKLLELGVSEEDARYYSYQNTLTYGVKTMLGRSWLHFMKERLCNRAQKEIRDMALKELELVSEVAPIIASKAGPECWGGACRQGRLACSTDEKKELFDKLRTYSRPEAFECGPVDRDLVGCTRVAKDFSASPEALCAAAARGCYSEKPARKILDDYLRGKDYTGVLERTISSGHVSVVEHAHFAIRLGDEWLNEFLRNPPREYSHDYSTGCVFLNARSANEYYHKNPGKESSELIKKLVGGVAPSLVE